MLFNFLPVNLAKVLSIKIFILIILNFTEKFTNFVLLGLICKFDHILGSLDEIRNQIFISALYNCQNEY